MSDRMFAPTGPPPTDTASPTGGPTQARSPPGTVRIRLVYKYTAAVSAILLVALMANGALEIWATWRDHQSALVRIQRDQAAAAAEKIGQFVREIEGQLGWTTQLSWDASTVEQRRFDAQRLLRQVPAITEVSFIDAEGREQLRVSRLAMDVAGSGIDLSADPKFAEAMAAKVYYGPVYFRRESEPYMTLSVAGARRSAGVAAAEVNLKFIWDVVSRIKVGEGGLAYAIDRRGRLIAHPDIGLVLRMTDLSGLVQVRAARDGEFTEHLREAVDLRGAPVLSASAPVTALGWRVFVELPVAEANAPLYAAMRRIGLILLVTLALAVVAGVLLARRLVSPIRALGEGAARIGAGELGQRIDIRTGDELEALAGEFNDMAARLEESYAGLERKVAERTHDLAEALEQQTATSEVLKVISQSTFDIVKVFEAVAESALRLCAADKVFVFRFDGELLHSVVSLNASEELKDYIRRNPIRPGRYSCTARAALERRIVHIEDVATDPEYIYGAREVDPVHTNLSVPMVKGDVLLGVITIYRLEVKPFSPSQIALLQTFADQAVIAIENVRLFAELESRNIELARSVKELRALGEVSQAVNSTLNIETVLATIVAKAVQLSGGDAGSIYVFDPERKEFRLRANYGLDDTMIAALRGHRVRIGETAVGIAAAERRAVQIVDVQQAPQAKVPDVILRAGYRAFMVVPLLGATTVVGALVVRRKAVGSFPEATVELLQTFAAQSVLAIQNARLFREIAEKSRELEVASRHKSQFLANMSHELRTPLNAILGYSELILDDIYGEPPEKMRGVLERVQSNGRHLLGLINDVLDLSKIEAGQLTLSLADYSLADVLQSVHSAVESLATEKRLAFHVDAPPNLPVGHGDERRLTQVLLNLAGNAIKFTDAGEVAIEASAANGTFRVSVHDTGPGIAAEDRVRIFEEFQQVDSTSTRQKGGSGLGLAISKRIIEMHGGRIWVDSEPGKGSTFTVSLPVTVKQQAGTP